MKPAFDKEETNQRQERRLSALEGLLELPATDFNTTLAQATSLIAEVLSADKVDIFFHDPSSETLVALGTSDTPMGRKQHRLGLHLLPLANGGRTVEVFLSGVSYMAGHVDEDAEELKGIKVGLGVKSSIGAVFEVERLHRGVLLAASASPAFFSEQDLRFLEATARWISIVIHRAELIERMKHEAVEQGRRLAAEELLTILAHDLRNYLTPLKGRIDMLALRAQRDEREQDMRDINSLNHTLGLLARVIDDLLDVARLNQGIFAVNPRLMNLVELIQEVAQAFGTPESPIQIQGPAKVILSADADRLRQLFENVFANAVKYAPKQTPIRVELRVEQRMDGPWVIVTVSNQGPGLPPGLLTTIFNPFVAGSQSTGLGLGLYLANRIAAAHNGTLTIDSAADKGVQVTLALAVEDEELIVDDE